MIYADANVVIRLIEGDDKARLPLETRLAPLRGSGRFFLTSRLTWLETRIKPLRKKNTDLLLLYDAFFSSFEVECLEITAQIIEKAAHLRAMLNMKTPDAIHLASAIIAGAEAFLTGDRTLTRCRDIAVEVL